MKTKSTLQQIVELSETPKEYLDKMVEMTIHYGSDKKHLYIYHNQSYDCFTIYCKWNNEEIRQLASFREFRHAIINLPTAMQ